MEWYNEFKELALYLMPLLEAGGGVGAAYVVQFLKEQLNIPSETWLLGWNKRTWLAIVVSFAIGLLASFAQGAFDPEQLTVVNFAETVATIVGVSYYWYKKVIDQPEEEEDPLIF